MTAKHTHKLKRLEYKSGNRIFFCVLPDCVFKMNSALALGKRTICWRCKKEFIMTEYSLRLAKPHCEACHRGKGTNSKEMIDMRLAAEATERKTLSLSERLSRTIGQAQPEEDEL